MTPALENGMDGLLKYLEGLSKSVVIVITLVSTVVVAGLDYLTGFEVSFAFFYLIPISLTAWLVSRRDGIIVSFISAIAWLIANNLAGERIANPIIPFWNAATRFGFFLVVTLLLSKLRQLLESERLIARTDFLTGAPNRRVFFDVAATAIAQAHQNQQPFTMVYIDLDNFKAVNDKFGHNVGDTVLQTVANMIGENIRATDIAARLGGDEFAMLLLGAGSETAQSIVSRLHRIMLMEMGVNQWPVTFSIGVLTFLESPRSVNEMIERADELVYDIKARGKNGIAYSVYS
jgi:diguanylate cyclase (GGDEF)-like protein